MKNIEEIREEYKIYEPKPEYKIFKSSLKEFKAYIKSSMDDVDEIIRLYTTEININKKEQLLVFLKSLFPFIFEDESTEIYELDNEILMEGLQFACAQRKYLEIMKHIVNEENYCELARLASFAVDYYNEFNDYVDATREVIETRLEGFTMYNSACSKDKDNREVIHDFIIEKLEEIRPVKGIQKVKKI